LSCKFSPDGHYLAACNHNKLKIQKTLNLQVIQTFTCNSPIQYVEWSLDSQFILCAQYKSGTVQVWSLDEPKWTCKIDDGSIGLVDARWATDSRHILTTSEFHLRITVWSLVNKSVSYIKYPKVIDKKLSFTKDNSYLAVAERRDCKDCISIFSLSTWQLVKHFDCDTKDLAGIAWSPTEYTICAWDSLLNYKVLLYSLDGQCIGTYTAYEGALAIKTVCWSPMGQFLAIGSYDQRVRIMNHLTWSLVAEYEHTAQIKNESVVVYQEVVNQNFETAILSSETSSILSKYRIIETRPITLLAKKPDPAKPNPELGVGQVLFSSNGQFLATKNDNFPTAVWIWDVVKLKLISVLMQKQAITCISWNPTKSHLALCTASPKIFLWTPDGCMDVSLPQTSSIDVTHLRWNSNGESLLLLGKDKSCICYTSSQKI